MQDTETVTMPTYDYKCGDCNAQDSVQASISDTPKAPECEICKVTMIRSYSFRSFKFNGKGFYSTDK